MIFKKLQMQGFKSFFDRTTVNFQSGINAVVGPNGCGKSNIADAIRWVLGEQSPKRLRGEAMEDLIFSGSEAHRPLGMAEVSLTVESNGRDFPSPYNKFTELCVTRRLYRSGESEFFINNTSCRLRDIRELFMDTGLNPKAYAVIDQGHIGDIVASKPEDRRIFIEEAAGIARYKERKAAALRKLDATEQNLLRLSDVIREVKRQIRSLKLQATKAEKYNALKGEIEELELKLLYRQHCSRQEESQLQQKKSSSLEEIRESLQRDSETAEAALEAGRLSLLELEKKVGEAQEDFYAHRARTESVGHLLEASVSRSGEISASVGRAEGDLRRSDDLLEDLARERSRTGDELEGLEEGLAGQEELLRRTGNDLSAAAESSAALRRELEERNDLFLEEVRAEGESRNRVTEAETLRASLGREIERLRFELEGAEEERGQLQENERALSTELAEKGGFREGVRRELETCQASLSKVRAELEELDASLNTARNEYGQATSRLASLNELEDNLSGWPERFREQLERILGNGQLGGGVRGLLAGYVEAPAEYETALEAVLGEKLKYLLVNGHETAMEAARALRESAADIRGTFIPLHPRRKTGGGPATGPGVIGMLGDLVRVPEELREVAGHLLEGVVLVEDLSSASSLWSANGAARVFVTPAGEVLWPDGSLTAGPLDPSRELLPLLRRIRETRKEVEEGRERLSRLETGRQRAVESLSSLTGREEELSEERYRLDIAVSSLEKDLAHTGQKLSSREEQAGRLGESLEKAGREMADLEARLSGEISRRAELETVRNRRAEENAALEEKLSTLQRTEEELRQSVGSLRADLAAGRERCSHLRDRLERNTRDTDRLKAQREELLAELTRLREADRQESEKAEDLRRQLRDLSLSQEERERKLATLQEEHRVASGRMRETEENLRRMRRKSSELQQERADIQARHAEIQVRIETIREKVLQIAQRPPGELWDEEIREEVRREDVGQIEEEHRQKAERLQSLGPVNLAAIGDHQELQERLEFQVTQQEDLEKAAQDLRQAIQKINATSRRLFADTFESINEKFQGIFPILFPGGQATLRLTDSDDPLEAGIEIFAQPSGKKLQRLSLLSGGEKALSAIALLLSIFMVKPTPFCLLDEVDAPLDESNTGRFLELMKASINGSQLVVITHNKQTMERAGNLVGVTMANPGISSLMSVKFQN